MKKLILSLVLLFMLPSSVWPAVIGTWEVSGNSKSKVAIAGASASEKSYLYDNFTFYENGTFESFEYGWGRWSQNDKLFTVAIDPLDVDNFEDQIEQEVWNCCYLDVDIEISSVSFNGVEKTSGIKGKIFVSGSVYYADYGLWGSLQIKAKFAGIGSQASGSPGSRVLDSRSSVIESIREGVTGVVLDRGF